MIGCTMHAVPTGDKLMIVFLLLVFLCIGAQLGRIGR